MLAKGADYLTREAWEADVPVIREAMLAGIRLDPLPRRTPLEATIHSRREHDGYTIENVYFQSIPGYYVTCNLYRPTRPGPHAAVINFHGHGAGRRTPDMDARCASLARMGAVALSVDMVGAGESPVPTNRHRNPVSLTMQAWNAMRAIDFVTSLEGVDADRIGVTGYSGGGTQTFITAALDPRVAVSAPVAMVSAFHFGGCDCESGLPIHKSSRHDINNPVIAALAAPRPQLIISDGGDWTANTPQVEFPFIKQIYTLLRAADQVENAHFPNGKHDYNAEKRAALYPFLARHLKLDLSAVQDAEGKITEAWLTAETPEALKAFDAEHPVPDDALTMPDAIREALEALQQPQ
jgi:dienelactone hydrolase